MKTIGNDKFLELQLSDKQMNTIKGGKSVVKCELKQNDNGYITKLLIAMAPMKLLMYRGMRSAFAKMFVVVIVLCVFQRMELKAQQPCTSDSLITIARGNCAEVMDGLCRAYQSDSVAAVTFIKLYTIDNRKHFSNDQWRAVLTYVKLEEHKDLKCTLKSELHEQDLLIELPDSPQ